MNLRLIPNEPEYQFSQRKLFYHKESLFKVLNGEMIPPVVIELSLCGKCNNSCVYCCCRDFHSNEMLSRKQIDEIVLQSSKIAKAITLTGGGEPTLNPYFSYAVKTISLSGLSIGLITNGTNLTRDNNDALARFASFCRVSLDTADNINYKLLRNPGCKNPVDKIAESLSDLKARKQRYSSYLQIGIQIVLHDQANEDIYKTVLFSKSLGVDFVQIRPEDNITGEESKPKYEFINGKREFLENLKTLSTDNFKVILNYNKLDEYIENGVEKSYEGCLGANFTASIGHDYKVYFCCSHIGNPKFLMGDLKEMSLNEILISPKRKELINFCDHEGCQMQCRNHQINKMLFELKNYNKVQIDMVIKKMGTGTPPMHYNFI